MPKPKPKFKNPVDELTDAIEEHGIAVQTYLRLAPGTVDLDHVRRVSGLDAARERMDRAIRSLIRKAVREAVSSMATGGDR